MPVGRASRDGATEERQGLVCNRSADLWGLTRVDGGHRLASGCADLAFPRTALSRGAKAGGIAARQHA